MQRAYEEKKHKIKKNHGMQCYMNAKIQEFYVCRVGGICKVTQLVGDRYPNE